MHKSHDAPIFFNFNTIHNDDDDDFSFCNEYSM